MSGGHGPVPWLSFSSHQRFSRGVVSLSGGLPFYNHDDGDDWHLRARIRAHYGCVLLAFGAIGTASGQYIGLLGTRW